MADKNLREISDIKNWVCIIKALSHPLPWPSLHGSCQENRGPSFFKNKKQKQINKLKKLNSGAPAESPSWFWSADSSLPLIQTSLSKFMALSPFPAALLSCPSAVNCQGLYSRKATAVVQIFTTWKRTLTFLPPLVSLFPYFWKALGVLILLFTSASTFSFYFPAPPAHFPVNTVNHTNMLIYLPKYSPLCPRCWSMRNQVGRETWIWAAWEEGLMVELLAGKPDSCGPVSA